MISRRQLDMSDRRSEQAEPERVRRRRVATVARVLAGDDVVLRVRHQPEHEAGLVADAGDVGDRAVRVAAAVAQRDLAGGGERVGVGVHVAALAVGDRAVDRGRRVPSIQTQRLSAPAASVTQRHSKRPLGVVAERTGQQPGAGEHLEAVADADAPGGRRRRTAQRVAEATVAVASSRASTRPAPRASA